MAARAASRRPTRAASAHEPDWEPPIPGRRRVLKTWDEYMAMAKRIIERFDHQFDLRHFDYMHPVRLQKSRAALPQALPGQDRLHRLGRSRRRPIVVCVGGVANTAMRFNYLAADLAEPLPRRVHGLGGPRPLGLDGRPARLFARDLRRAAAPADRRTWAASPVILLGSSLGGSAAIELAAQPSAARAQAHPERHRPAHPEGAAQAPLRHARAPLRLPRALRTCCARSAPRRRTTAPSPTTSAST